MVRRVAQHCEYTRMTDVYASDGEGETSLYHGRASASEAPLLAALPAAPALGCPASRLGPDAPPAEASLLLPPWCSPTTVARSWLLSTWSPALRRALLVGRLLCTGAWASPGDQRGACGVGLLPPSCRCLCLRLRAWLAAGSARRPGAGAPPRHDWQEGQAPRDAPALGQPPPASP